MEAGNGQKEFPPGAFNEQASPESRLLVYGKARTFVGSFPLGYVAAPSVVQ